MIYRRIARLNTNGSTDSTFDPGVGANGEVMSVAVRADGKVAVGGSFGSINDENHLRLALLQTDGSPDPTFTPSADNEVTSIIAQADGKLVIAGRFTSVSGQTRNRCARLLPTGELEPAFNPNFNGNIFALAGREDGKVLAGGDFGGVHGTTHDNIVLLLNNPAISTLSIVSASEVFWERSATAPETLRVLFEYKETGDPSWTSLGPGVREIGGWRATGLTLPSDGILRARAFPYSAYSEGVIEESLTFDFVPEIQVEQPEGTILTSGGSLAYPSTQAGLNSDKGFTIRNIGLEDLTLTGGTPVTLSGTNADQWSILAQPASPVMPNGVSVFTLRFKPTTAGTKSATLTIASDDADEGTFTVLLSGVATPGPGSRDATFQPVANTDIDTVAIDPLDNILFGGNFTSFNSAARNRLARVLAIGFNDPTLGGTGANNQVFCVALQSDGKIVVGGIFTTFNSTPAVGLPGSMQTVRSTPRSTRM